MKPVSRLLRDLQGASVVVETNGEKLYGRLIELGDNWTLLERHCDPDILIQTMQIISIGIDKLQIDDFDYGGGARQPVDDPVSGRGRPPGASAGS